MDGYKHISVQAKLEEIVQLVDEGIRDAEFPQNCKRYIEAVLEEVKELVIFFKHSFISKNKFISEFLLYVLKNIGNYDDSDIKNIKSLLKQLLYYLGNTQFKGKEDILQWIKGSIIPNVSQVALEVSDFFYFTGMVEEFVISVLDICDENSKDDGKILSATRDLIFCAMHQENMLIQCGDHYGIFLLKILLLPLNYNNKNNSFDSPVSKKLVQTFVNNIKEKSSELIKVKEDGVQSTEAYLLQTLIEIWQEDNQTHDKEDYYGEILKKLKNIFSFKTKEILEADVSIPINWKKLESAVQSIRYGMSLANIDCDIIGQGLLDLIESTVDTEAHVENLEVADQNDLPVKCDVLEKLGLIPYYPCKIELKDVMLNSSEKVDTLADIPWFVFHRLLMLDYKGRNSMKFPTDVKQGSLSERSEATNEEVLMDIFSEIDEITVEGNSSLAPMDVVVALYLCSSSFLKQTLAEKLFMCRLSIPLILPDIMDNRPTYLLWSLRNVIAEFELSKDKVIENSVASHPFPIVSFVRLGDLARSKSKLLNDIISNQAHSVFFHRDCDNSMIHQDISGGLVDVAWFLSSIKQDHSFKEPITFMNLHGDGNKYKEQCQFLCKVSNVMSVMVDIEDLSNIEIISTLQNIVKSDTQVLYIFTKKSERFTILKSQEVITKCFKEIGLEKINKNNVILDFTKSGSRTASEMKIETANKISACLIGKGGITLESCKTIIGNYNLKLKVDENDLNCVEGHKIALQVLEHVKEENLIDTKKNMLPLQGDLWIKWGRLEKKEHRKDGTAHFSPEHYAAQLHDKKKGLRREQLVICNNPPKLMKAFITYLLKSQGSTRLYFLKWLKIYLDSISRRTLPGIHKEYSKQWNEIQNYKSEKKITSKNDTYVKEMQSKLENFEEKLAQTSFGVEHLMREIGQVYEAVNNLSDRVAPKLKEDIHKLPKVVAELLLSGSAVELMDGDSAHVPHSWVSAVFTKLQEIIGDKRLFVLSVLGVQSSGKSTLLNTMFGLQFAVSAGRCTRGVYAQLVPVVKDHDNGYDFILVVDTEGLRAPELGSAKHQHDNELATLVIGVGDLTILNIKGENPAEMQDVLQICVHAILRLHQVNKSIKLQPSCVFIHQNVGSVNAKQKMMFAQKKLKESLDKMTKAAADQEDVLGINSFGQVINFDVEKNVYYFSDLWQGDPPMAPVNPGYSSKINEVKLDLFHTIMPTKTSNVTISKISLRISDLWKGILAEDFVFSFRNSLEIKAYTSLESTYASLSWDLQNNADKWFSTLRMKIQGSESGLDKLESQLLQECNSHITDLYDKTHKDLVDFFENNEDKELTEQWKEKRLIKLNVLKEDILMMIRKDCMNEIVIRKSKVLEQVELRKHKENIKSKARDLAIELQSSGISPRELNNKFDNLWMELLEKLPGRRIDEKLMLKVKLNKLYMTCLKTNTPF
ncbi:unnamed protein product [Meganyctiphanes norvegica]|uniref:VLIG-type G domain-containing protein n=1 Tax=Meganyctiphanes norvegica TaxID=48144 RepID=A0AAV2QHJ1_MEGNR